MTAPCTDPAVGARLAAYELGLLDGGAAAEVEAHVRACEGCRESLYAMAPLAVGITSEPGAVHRALAVRSLAGRIRSWLPARRVWLVPPVAAAALGLVVTLLLRGPGGLADLAEIEPVPYVPLDVRGGEPIGEGMRLYAEGRYADAADVLVRAVEAGDESARFHAGLSLLLAGRAGDALLHLRGATGSPLPVEADRARWYLAQAYLTLGRGADARAELERLRQSPGYARRAAAQLRELDRREG
jgi:hypothetical protein